jgi:hypothetical protein
MSRPDKTTEATLRMLHAPVPSVVPVSEPMPPVMLPKVKTSDRVVRTMVYLPPVWKEKFREIAYHERRKENDLSLEAFRNYLLLKGHKID